MKKINITVSKKNLGLERGETLSIPKTAEYFGVDRSVVQRWLEAGALVSVKTSGVTRVSVSSINIFQKHVMAVVEQEKRIDELKTGYREAEECLRKAVIDMQQEMADRKRTPDVVERCISRLSFVLEKILDGAGGVAENLDFIRMWIGGYDKLVIRGTRNNGINYGRSSYTSFLRSIKELESYAALKSQYNDLFKLYQTEKLKNMKLERETKQANTTVEVVKKEPFLANTDNQALMLRCKDVGFSVRTVNGLTRAEIMYIAQLVEYSEDELLSMRGVGRKCLLEIIDWLGRHDLSLRHPD